MREARRPPRVAMLTVAGVCLIAGAVMLDAALQIRGARGVYRESRRRFHPFLQLRLTPEVRDGVNEHGFRGEPIADEPRPPGFLVFTLGGSTTLGVSNRYPDTYPARLQRMLRERYPGVPIMVQNAGVDWYTTAHSLINYQLRVRRFAPDLVIAMHAMNDLYRSFSPPWFASGSFQRDYSHYLGPQARLLGPEMGFVDASREQGPFGALLWRYVRALVRREPSPYEGRAAVDRLKERLEPRRVDRFPSLEVFASNYAQLARAVRADGTSLAILSEAFIYRHGLTPAEAGMLYFAPVFASQDGGYPDLDSMARGMRLFNDRAREAAAASGAAFLDVEAAVPKSGPYFTDDVHLTAAGNEILARLAFDWIVAERLVERK